MYVFRYLVGIIVILLGIAIGLYVGVWWAFIGGVVRITQQVQSNPIDALLVAYGVAKVVFSAIIGSTVGVVIAVCGYLILPD